MTEEQMELAKQILDKHGITATDAEWSLVLLGVGYGLTEKQIDSYLTLEFADLLLKHEKMLCILFEVEPDTGRAIQEIVEPAERLLLLLAEHFGKSKRKQDYGEVMEYVSKDSGLSAAQIEQLRKAVEAEMPAEDVLEMARNRKDVMEIRRCVEFYEMMKKEQEPQEKEKKNRRERR